MFLLLLLSTCILVDAAHDGAGSGQQLRSDDPSALKDIIALVKQKMQGVDPQTMKSVTVTSPQTLTGRCADAWFRLSRLARVLASWWSS